MKPLLCVITAVQNIVWTPSKLIARLGKEIDNPESVYYWCYKVLMILCIVTQFNIS